MKFKLSANVSIASDEIGEVVKMLEKNLGPKHLHHRMSLRGFFVSEKWRLDHCLTHWELVLDRRHTNKAWFTEFALRWI